MIRQTNLIFKHAQIRVKGNTVRCENHTVQMSEISQLWIGKGLGAGLPFEMAVIIILINMAGIHFLDWIPAVLTVICSMAFLAWRQVSQQKEGLHMKMASGDIYSFIPDNKYFLDQVYSLLNEILIMENTPVDYSIMFDGNGEIVNHFAASQAKKKRQRENVSDEKAETENLKKEAIKEEKKTEEKKTAQKENLQKAKVSYSVNDQLLSQLQTLYTVYSEREDADEEIISLIGQTADKVKSNDMANIKELYGKFIESGLINECNDLGLNVLISEIKSHIFV